MPIPLILMLLLLAAPDQLSRTQAPPAGEGKGACAAAGCHAGLMGRARTHAPAAEGECGICHEHGGGSEHEFRPASEPVSRMCLPCHDMPSGEGVKVHGALEAGQCTDCHDPHSSDGESLLRTGTPALCLTCHDDPSAAGKNVHGALEAGGCTGCHDPHASRHNALLAAGLPDLCVDCHEDPRKEGGHVHAAAEEGDCTLCHAPHASPHRRLVREATKDLCTSCHEEQAEEIARPNVHGVIESVGCSACHNPHAASAPLLLRSEGNDLCGACHLAPTPLAGSGQQNERTTLFGSIEVDTAWLAGLPRIALSDGAGHPVGRHPVQAASDPRRPGKTFWCVSCHEPHGSARESLLAGPTGMGLCIQCHKK